MIFNQDEDNWTTACSMRTGHFLSGSAPSSSHSATQRTSVYDATIAINIFCGCAKATKITRIIDSFSHVVKQKSDLITNHAELTAQ